MSIPSWRSAARHAAAHSAAPATGTPPPGTPVAERWSWMGTEASGGDCMQASRRKALGFPVRAKSEQRPGEKAKWAVEPPSRALSTLAGPQTIAPTCRLGEPRSRARCRGLRGFKSSSSSSGSRTPVTAVVAGGCDRTTVASPIGARTSPPPRATRRAPANASPSVNSGDERAGGNGPRQGRRRDGSEVPPTPSRLPPRGPYLQHGHHTR